MQVIIVFGGMSIGTTTLENPIELTLKVKGRLNKIK